MIGYENKHMTMSCMNSLSATVYNVSSHSNTTIYSIPPHEESDHMIYGKPTDVAICAHNILKDIVMNQSYISNNSDVDIFGLPSKIITNDYGHTLVHIASDNLGSSTQMNEVLNWPNTLISPSGCHIDYNSTFECIKLTTVYWFIMSLSDVIISPTQYKVVRSGFPRSAAIYGLKKNVLRDPTDCNNIISNDIYSHIHQGNWFCNVTCDIC